MFLLVAIYALVEFAVNGFVLDSIEMSDAIFEQCSFCDERSNRAGSRAVSNTLRDYMSQNHINILLEQDEVEVQQRYPNENIDTGHSCSKTAHTMNTVAKARMIPGTARLSPEGVTYDDLLKLAFAASDVDHEVQVAMDIRVNFGSRWFGKCKNIGRKTCHGVTGASRGTNHVIVVMQASNVMTECIGGQEHLTFNIDVKVTNAAKDKTYSPVTANQKQCDALGGLINIRATDYANRYFRATNFRELRGTKLINELESKLQAKMGSTVSVAITTSGKPRSCSRFRRDVNAIKERCSKMKTCPNDFTRMGNQEICGKYMGMEEPNCSIYGETASVLIKKSGTHSLYWCTTPMV